VLDLEGKKGWIWMRRGREIVGTDGMHVRSYDGGVGLVIVSSACTTGVAGK
jgi:hypothetical protein